MGGESRHAPPQLVCQPLSPCLTLSSLPTSSQMGARLLQWPLHTLGRQVGQGRAAGQPRHCHAAAMQRAIECSSTRAGKQGWLAGGQAN